MTIRISITRPKQINMHLRRRLDTIGGLHQIDQQDVKPNFFAAAPPPLPAAATKDQDIDSGSNGKAGGGARAAARRGLAVHAVLALHVVRRAGAQP